MIDIKKMNNGQSERFRLVVSDGGHHQQSMLATQLNSVRRDARAPARCARSLRTRARELTLPPRFSQQLINDGSLQKFSVLQLDEYIVNSVQMKKYARADPETDRGTPIRTDTKFARARGLPARVGYSSFCD